MQTLEEVIFKYSKETIIVIMDIHKKPWFNATHIATILKYYRPREIIRQLVENEYIKYFKEIVDDYKIYHNAQPMSLFINESGIYALLLRSKKKEANKFYKWVIQDVLPSIRNKGYYELEEKHKIKINQLNEKIIKTTNELDEAYNRIKVLENNQAIKHITKGRYIYIIKSADNNKITLDLIELYKIGKTIKFNARINTMNTTNPDNVIILYRVKIDDISAVENCLKGMLSKQVYRSNREYYQITLKNAIKMIKLCIKLTKSKLISEDKLYKNYIIKRSNTNINRPKVNILKQKINIIFDNESNNKEQLGGLNIDTDIYDDIIILYKLNKIVFKIFDII
jgi:prophage antirepressor-like protein